MALLEITGLKKSFRNPEGGDQLIIDLPQFGMERSAQVALAGESGCGKTTFLHLIAGILRSDAGKVMLAGSDLGSMSEAKRDRFRARHIGYIFQTFNLLPSLTCLENVLAGMAFGHGVNRSAAKHLLERVGLGDRLHYYPQQLSVGQQQRVAVARALANQPLLILADEPTGNLDHRRAQEAITLIREICREIEAALLLVSHDRGLLETFQDIRDFNSINLAVAATSVA